ncbi:ATP-binding protein [Deferribacter autotrophicus]|uniref:ATP-binding protein n=1 Tax=Deferribacter autotrophicus TaxID=500465 RepID=A0A5A8F8V3_9BACT|nr:ATP-binding protein [Deferribacter autotrophicus]KAA0259092.1 ATP-binding protein [Deferribacter autotrophicus]
MKFYNREKELDLLKKAEQSSFESSFMTFIVGRRRVGKTRLIKEAYKDKKLLYFFVAKKSEKLLCEEYKGIIEGVLGKRIIGQLTNFKEIFEYLMSVGESEQINIAIDEFQEFQNINPSVYSDMQNIWDEYKPKSKVNLILSGSIYSLMSKIFEDSKEPLFGRADRKIVLEPFDVNTLKEIYADYAEFNAKDFVSFYAITGGMAKYIEILCKEKAMSLEKIIDMVFCDGSFFLAEGREVLIGEFGKDYHTYFSILSLVAGSKTFRSEIEGVLEKSVGGFLEKLEKNYRIIKRVQPVFSKPNARNVKYEIIDNFLSFWFMFVYKNLSAVEIKNFDYLKKYTLKYFDQFLGRKLEKYFKEKLASTNEYSMIGSYWDKKGENEIDIVAVNEMEKRALIAEVKLNKNKINLQELKEKSKKILRYLKGFKIEYKGFGLEDV